MSEHRDDAPALHLVPATDGDPTGTPDVEATDATDAAEVSEDDGPRDPLLARAERIADLPLAERPAAFDGLNRAVVAELNTLEEG